MSKSAEENTVKERNLVLNLSDADVKKLCNKAWSADLSVNGLIEAFIADLVDGACTNGSDERMLANQWYERCWFGMFPRKTLIRYLIEHEEMDGFLDELEVKELADDSIKTIEKEISTGVMSGSAGNYTWKDIVYGDGKPCYDSREDWELSQKECIEQEQEILEAAEQEIKEIWERFLYWTDEKDLSLSEEIQKVKQYESALSCLMKGKSNV